MIGVKNTGHFIASSAIPFSDVLCKDGRLLKRENQLKHVNITVTTRESTQSLSLRRGLGLQALAVHCPALEFDCRKADCGICIVKVLQGADSLSPAKAREADFLKAMRADPDERLACQCRVFGDLALAIEGDM